NALKKMRRAEEGRSAAGHTNISWTTGGSARPQQDLGDHERGGASPLPSSHTGGPATPDFPREWSTSAAATPPTTTAVTPSSFQSRFNS
uniref:Uncharacterized protein n=1 Tax=Aegilops tauschii subsp. strangulata TaxID=200361 RepID=A0A453AJP9_AEGTS